MTANRVLPVPKELYYLLKRWGRVGMVEGGPRLKIAPQPCFREYRPRRPKDEEPIKFDRDMYEQMIFIIETYLTVPQKHCLMNKFRYNLNPRKSARDMGISVVEVKTLYDQSTKKIEKMLSEGLTM